MKNNNKGFSMVELLAVIVILGIISTISIVSVSRLVERSRDNYYETQQEQLVLAAQSYANDNKIILPKEIGAFSTIYLQELYDKKYITDKIVDQNKNECYVKKSVDATGKTIEGSRVEIYKSSKTDYKYVGYLECYACKKDKNSTDSTCYDPKTRLGPEIKIDIPNISGNNIMNKDYKISITITGNKNDSNIKVSSYSYKIYVDGKLRKSSGLVINNKQSIVNISDDLFKYVPGIVKVVVSTTNTDGISLSKSATRDLKDAVPPQCGRVSYEGANAMNAYDSGDSKKCGSTGYAWINIETNPATRQGWVVCDDKFGVGCMQHEYSNVMNTDGEDEIIKVKDKDGKEYNCNIKKCIDRTSSKLIVNIFKLPSNGKVPLKSDGTVNLTPIKSYEVKSQTSNQKYSKSDKYDSWLNKEIYPYGVILEAIVEEPTSKIKTFSWYQNPKNKKENQEGDATEKVKVENNITKAKYPVNQTIKDDGVRKEVFKIIDNAGNEVTYTLIIKIDRTAPPVPTVAMYKEDSDSATSKDTKYTNNSWTNKYVWTNTNHPTDNPDVSGWKTNQYTTTGDHGANSNIDGNDVHINNEGTSTIKYRSCDNAGNCSAYSGAKTIKLDRTSPNCSISANPASPNGNNNWYTQNISFSLNKSDKKNSSNNTDGSGTKTYGLATSAKSTNKKTTGTQSANTNSVTWYSYSKDNADNECTSSKTVKLDKNAPSVPTVYMKKWKTTTAPTSGSGLENYSNNTWYKGKVFTYASSTDGISGVKQYMYTTTGTTTNNTDKASSYRNIEAEGVSKIKYKACDDAGNCSNYSSEKTIKLDRTAPTCNKSFRTNSDLSAITAKITCSDSYSGCKSNNISQTYTNKVDFTYQATFEDNAGNSFECVWHPISQVDVNSAFYHGNKMIRCYQGAVLNLLDVYVKRQGSSNWETLETGVTDYYSGWNPSLSQSGGANYTLLFSPDDMIRIRLHKNDIRSVGFGKCFDSTDTLNENDISSIINRDKSHYSFGGGIFRHSFKSCNCYNGKNTNKIYYYCDCILGENDLPEHTNQIFFKYIW